MYFTELLPFDIGGNGEQDGNSTDSLIRSKNPTGKPSYMVLRQIRENGYIAHEKRLAFLRADCFQY